MKRRETFEKKYPLLLPYFEDENVRNNMLDNQDFYIKYQKHEELISAYINELAKWFEPEVVKKVIIMSILRYPDNLMISIITAYLNSSEETKANPNFIKYYSDTSILGKDATEYIEKHGIITNRSYKEIPNKVIDEKYNALKTGEEVFKGVRLDDIYASLSYPKRRLVVDLLGSGILENFDRIFESVNFSFTSILEFLFKYNIDSSILNDIVYRTLGDNYVMILVCLIIEQDDAIRTVETLKKICKNRQYLLLKSIIDNNLFTSLTKVSYDEIEDKTFEETMEILKKQEVVLKIQEN